jgi:2-methylcitrate dehydratase PrpD
MAMVKVNASTDLDCHFPKYWSGRVTVKLADGQTHSEEIIVPKGESENPLTRAEVEEKFVGLAAPVLGEKKSRAVIAEVSALDSRVSLVPLLTALSA